MLIGGQPQVQFSYFDATRDITKNYSGTTLEKQLDQLLALPFKQIVLTTTNEEIHVLINNSGDRININRKAAQTTVQHEHNRQKQRLINPENAQALLEALDVTTREGVIKNDAQRKYIQINEFLKLVQETGFFDQQSPEPLTMLDLGCGNAMLSFGLYHYVTTLLGQPATLMGVDLKADLIKRNNHKAQQLGWAGIQFEVGRIANYRPATSPNVVVALHACDTATDEALALGIRHGSRLIISAPCCHHHMQVQLEQQATPSPFQPVLRHAIFKERIGDLLTDSLRALLLRMHGYTTDIIEFVGSEHTPKNLMIRALKSNADGEQRAREEYQQLKTFWGVTPYLETLLEHEQLV